MELSEDAEADVLQEWEDYDDYYRLSFPHKAYILSYLCNLALGTQGIQ